MKEVKTKKPENIEAEVQTREIEKPIETFNLENELNKIKIPIPLVELARNPIYKKQIAKEIHFLMLNVKMMLSICRMKNLQSCLDHTLKTIRILLLHSTLHLLCTIIYFTIAC
jgi:hypothetical protein